jgi:hypothetical protein
MAHEDMSPPEAGATRRDFLKRSAIVGGAVWAIPAVQMVSMSAAHADSPSAPSNPGTPSTPGNPAVPPGNPVVPPGGPSTELPPTGGAPIAQPAVLPATQPAVSPNTAVLGTQVQAAGATLPKTGADFPVAATLALGAGLIVAGSAAVASSREQPATDGDTDPGRHARSS